MRCFMISALLGLLVLGGCRKQRVISNGAAAPGVRAPVAQPGPRQHPARTRPPPVTGPPSKQRAMDRKPPHAALRHEVLFGADGSCRVARTLPCRWKNSSQRGYRSIFVRHPSLSQGRLLLSIPERLRVYLPGHDRRVLAKNPARRRQPRWQFDAQQIRYSETWQVPDPAGGAAMALAMSWRVFCAGPGNAGLELTLVNNGPRSLGVVEAEVCLAAMEGECSGQRELTRVGGVMRHAHTTAGWSEVTRMGEMQVINGARPVGMTVITGTPEATDGLIVGRNARSGWLMALGWDRAVTVSLAAWDCIHSHPHTPTLKPGAKITRRGRIYLFKGDLKTVLQAYRRDLPTTTSD